MHKAVSKTKTHRNILKAMSLSFLRSQEAVPRRARLRSIAGFVFDAKDCIEVRIEYKIKSETEIVDRSVKRARKTRFRLGKSGMVSMLRHFATALVGLGAGADRTASRGCRRCER